MQPSAVSAVRHVIDEYSSFLKTSYRFFDDRLREQFERHLSEIGVVVKGPYFNDSGTPQRISFHRVISRSTQIRKS